MKIALVQVNPIIGDFEYNFEKIISNIEIAKSHQCDLAIFSELVISGYPPRDLLEKNEFIDRNTQYLNELLKTVKDIGVIVGFVEKNPDSKGKALFNSAMLFENGRVLHIARKRLLPTYDVFDEGRYFEAGTDSVAFPYKDHRIGLTICEDIWNDSDIFAKPVYSTDPIKLLMADHSDIIINISASPFYEYKRDFKFNMLSSMSKKYQAIFVYVNQVGGNDSVLFDGTSVVFGRDGKIKALAKDFQEDLIIFDTKTQVGDIHKISDNHVETVFDALTMGTHDYVTKCGFKDVHIGLSGGIDSAITAAIAVRALGHERVFSVFMPSVYTSKDNYEDTQQLADNLGISLKTISITSINDAFLNELGFSSSDHGVAEQNIQARIRGTILMALSNKYNSLVLTTGNKSELAVGYCTLYGDMNGGLAVISDVSKMMVYQIAHLINREKTIIPQRIIEKAPSAELKPNQKDQDDLPPYDVLDQILKAYIEDNKTSRQIVDMGFSEILVKDIIRRIHRNEYKRHQAAPGLKLSQKAFGYGRRYPIVHHFN